MLKDKNFKRASKRRKQIPEQQIKCTRATIVVCCHGLHWNSLRALANFHEYEQMLMSRYDILSSLARGGHSKVSIFRRGLSDYGVYRHREELRRWQ